VIKQLGLSQFSGCVAETAKVQWCFKGTGAPFSGPDARPALVRGEARQACGNRCRDCTGLFAPGKEAEAALSRPAKSLLGMVLPTARPKCRSLRRHLQQRDRLGRQT
jgi:hypothetical protein